MKKCIACGVLLCLVLTACAAGAETPTTTEPQLQISSTTTSTIPTVPSSTTPPTSCTPTTVPTTKPTTEPTTKPATMPTDTIDPDVAHGVRVVSGNQMIVPVEAYRGGRFFSGTQWLYPDGIGIAWTSLDLREMPIITMDETVTVLGNTVAEFRVKEIDGEDFEDTSVDLVNTLPSGIYMVEFGITYYRGAQADGEKGFDAYEYGFLLVIPGSGADKPLPDPCANGHRFYFGQCDICKEKDPNYVPPENRPTIKVTSKLTSMK